MCRFFIISTIVGTSEYTAIERASLWKLGIDDMVLVCTALTIVVGRISPVQVAKRIIAPLFYCKTAIYLSREGHKGIPLLIAARKVIININIKLSPFDLCLSLVIEVIQKSRIPS